MPPDRLLTAAQLAARLQVDPSTVHRWNRQGRLASVQLGPTRRGVRFPWPQAISAAVRQPTAQPMRKREEQTKPTPRLIDMDAWLAAQRAELRGGRSAPRNAKTRRAV